jgi:hypothetical protein
MTFDNPAKSVWMKRCLLGVALLAAMGSAGAVERTLKIEAPVAIRAGRELMVKISASTDAGKGEQIGFLQAEYSLDEGKTWTAICYLQKCGPQIMQDASVKTGPGVTTVKLRARAAFRDGLAGDVDYSGAAIRWDGSWKEWQTPPAKLVVVKVVAR